MRSSQYEVMVGAAGRISLERKSVLGNKGHGTIYERSIVEAGRTLESDIGPYEIVPMTNLEDPRAIKKRRGRKHKSTDNKLVLDVANDRKLSKKIQKFVSSRMMAKAPQPRTTVVKNCNITEMIQ